MAGPQHSECGVFPNWPNGDGFVGEVGSVKLLPLKYTPPFFLGFKNCTGAVSVGVLASSKKKLLSSSPSFWSSMRIGKPLWQVMIADNCQPFSNLPATPSLFGIGRSHTGLNTNRFFALNSESPRVALKLSGLSCCSKEAP